MPKPFANAPEFTGTILDTYIFAIQVGNTQGDPGLAEMMHISGEKLKAYVRNGMGNAMNFIGSLAALPDSPQINDYFLASSTWVVGDQTFTEGRLYEYNGSAWFDISNVLEQYVTNEQFNALDSEVDGIDARVAANESDISDLKDRVAGLQGGIKFKGDCTQAQLEALIDQDIGDEWWVTDVGTGVYKVWNGTAWIATEGSGSLGLSWESDGSGDQVLCIEVEE